MVQNLSQKNSNIINEITEKSLIKVHFGNSKQEKLITVILHSYRTTTTTRLHLSVRDKLFISSGKSSRLNPLSHPKNGYKDELHRKKRNSRQTICWRCTRVTSSRKEAICANLNGFSRRFSPLGLSAFLSNIGIGSSWIPITLQEGVRQCT